MYKANKNSRKSDRVVQQSPGESGSSGKSKSINVNIDQGWSKKTKVSLWLPDDDSNDNDSLGISVNLNTRHNTCPNINEPSQFSRTLVNTGRNMSLPTAATPRKSLLGELKTFLTFNKKPDDTNESSQQDNESTSLPTGAKVTISKEFDRENKKVALQNRRKQVFQKQDDGNGGEGSSDTSNLAAVGGTVNKLQMSLKKWKIKKNTEVVRDTIAVNKHHQKILDDCADRLQTEIPFPLHIIMKEEALMISNCVHQMYKSMLGSKHKLTKEAQKHIVYLQQSMYVPDVK